MNSNSAMLIALNVGRMGKSKEICIQLKRRLKMILSILKFFKGFDKVIEMNFSAGISH
jgi:hypothetical protein